MLVHLVGHVNTFQKKLRRFASCLKLVIVHILILHIVVVDYEVEFSRFVENIDTLSCEFSNIFMDFVRLKPNLHFYETIL